ncbi:myb-like protein D [Aphis craccivora]|uniref:Myb-like protein D n=1 Tax=Aphis craccivora TaxID=307492 RepID=A0A6G0VVS8_APHCR|nr:myb-like protein D [Aphis craccivora]
MGPNWMTAGLLCSARKKQKLSLKVKMHANNKSLVSYYIKYKNNFTTILRRAKINFYQTKFSAVASNPKLTWKVIKEVTDTEIKNSNEIKTIIINNKVINTLDEPYKVTQFFNDFFIQVGNQKTNNCNNHTNTEDITEQQNYSFDTAFKEQINELDISQIIDKLKDDTSAGYDKISVKLLKYIAKIFQYGIRVWGGLTQKAIKPLQLQQNKIIRICLNKYSLEGSTSQNYKELKVLPINSLYKKFAIMWVVKNMENWYNADKSKQTRENRAYDAKINYTNTSFSQKFVDYLGLKFYNSLDLDLKKK